MKLDVRTVLILADPDGRRILLLRRSATKKLFPNLITGIGGKVELSAGEGDDLETALWREVAEETRIPREQIADVRLRLSTLLTRDDEQIVLLWFTGTLLQTPTNLSCTEGMLEFFDPAKLPLAEMIPTAREAIRFIVSLPKTDQTIYNGIYDAVTLKLTTSPPHLASPRIGN